MKDKIKTAFSAIVFFLVIITAMRIASDSVETVPAHAIVLLDSDSLEYYAPPYILELFDEALGEEIDKIEDDKEARFYVQSLIFEMGLRPVSVQAARDLGAKPNKGSLIQSVLSGTYTWLLRILV
jgi:hypothetical protein